MVMGGREGGGGGNGREGGGVVNIFSKGLP